MERRGKAQQQMSSLVSAVFSETSIAVGVMVGILLMWVATVMVIPGEPGRTVYEASSILSSLGTVFLTIMLVGGGIVNTRIDRVVRVGMVIMGTILLAGFFFASFLSAFGQLIF